MSYESLEISQDSAKPISLFDIEVGNTHWYFTNADSKINYSANVYEQLEGIAHSNIKDAISLDDGKVSIDLPYNHAIAQLFKLGAPGGRIFVTIYQGNAGDTSFVQAWQGRVVEYSFELPTFRLQTESVLTAMRRLASGFLISTSCTVDVFSPECGLDKDDYKLLATVSDKSGLTVTATAIGTQPDKWFLGGWAEWTHPSLGDVVMTGMILDHVDDTITFAMPIPTITTGTVLTIYPGCNHEYGGDCGTKFANQINFQGGPFINNRNPFDGYRLY